MKTLFITFGLLAITLGSFRNPSNYLEVMQENIQKLYQAQTIGDVQPVVNAFTRIAQAEKEEWHPLYYAAFGNIIMSAWSETTADKDKYLDQAETLLEQANKRIDQEPELKALEGYIQMMRVAIDPASRGPQYSGLATQTLSQAVQMDPENPRALTLLAQMEMGTARFFGSEPTEACAKLDKAITLFENDQPEHPLDPAWGLESARAAKQQCP